MCQVSTVNSYLKGKKNDMTEQRISVYSILKFINNFPFTESTKLKLNEEIVSECSDYYKTAFV